MSQNKRCRWWASAHGYIDNIIPHLPQKSIVQQDFLYFDENPPVAPRPSPKPVTPWGCSEPKDPSPHCRAGASSRRNLTGRASPSAAPTIAPLRRGRRPRRPATHRNHTPLRRHRATVPLQTISNPSRSDTITRHSSLFTLPSSLFLPFGGTRPRSHRRALSCSRHNLTGRTSPSGAPHYRTSHLSSRPSEATCSGAQRVEGSTHYRNRSGPIGA